MENINIVHCLFEQSGTFKSAFRKHGLTAFDYDISDDFFQTDFVMDLFRQIHLSYNGERSIFSNFTSNDLIIAFFPCTYFCDSNQLFFTGKHNNLLSLSPVEKLDTIIERADNRQLFYSTLLQLFRICESRNLRLIVENPYSPNSYLYNNLPYKPAVIDRNRTLRGDLFVKPTMYYFLNCTPTFGTSFVRPKSYKRVMSSHGFSRSLISPEYAYNFVSDFILGSSNSVSAPEFKFD